LAVNELRREDRQPIELIVSRAVVDRKVAILLKASFPEPIMKCGDMRWGKDLNRDDVQPTDHRPPLLRIRHKGPRSRAANHPQELPPLHSSTQADLLLCPPVSVAHFDIGKQIEARPS
jgi:hypothetical protein